MGHKLTSGILIIRKKKRQIRKIGIMSAAVNKCSTCFSDTVSKTAKNQVKYSTDKKSLSVFRLVWDDSIWRKESEKEI